MSAFNWITIVLSIVLWMMGQNIGAGIGMASSTPGRKGSREDIYLNRLQGVQFIVAIGALLTFISQLIPIPIVKTIGLIILPFPILAVAVLYSGLLSRRLPEPDVTPEEQLAIQARLQEKLISEGWTSRPFGDDQILWSRPQPPESADTDITENDEDIL